jgi:hypothetical protein
MQSTGQTAMHCDSSKCPTHSVHLSALTMKMSSPALMALLGQSGSHAAQLMQSAVMSKAISVSYLNYLMIQVSPLLSRL